MLRPETLFQCDLVEVLSRIRSDGILSCDGILARLFSCAKLGNLALELGYVLRVNNTQTIAAQRTEPQLMISLFEVTTLSISAP